ncbi:selenocysteine-specific translation elongation factor SelB [Geothermobacter ehrlichii]|uniref:Selenocysteine-specific elongation factor n=1 Tax=Geothermobacter ehrlichii TaxID=213224 RepID=A0A5D3WF56_9BACT|nr:selenocysteine-specific translation elongation factor [Geothermobacter ehrlichii]TYO96112.1 selenocysteine-specific translation elongation factor SelB [Geothermobacter ehrlichii]
MSRPQQHVIIGTAGHVDHGKTVLIRALTGVETDRLKEEKKRGISIELGFAPFRLPDGTLAGVVDVPGHERFINNMLAGIGGIDLVLLVVDVNEGVMPQTREHLQILKLLRIPRGIIVLTKCDQAEDDLIELVEEEIREEVAGSFLDGAPCCRVAALHGEGIPELVRTIAEEVRKIEPKPADGPLRLPVDRHFSVAGFGTVITGTLLSGRVRPDDQVDVLPADVRVRVREVQVHGRKVAEAVAGQRVALNLAGLDRNQVPRGSVVATPGIFAPTRRLDARLDLLPEALRPLRFRDPVHLMLGTARAVGIVALLDRDVLRPGESAIVQIHLDRPLVAHRLDRFIIRSYSPVTTIGGGLVVDPAPNRHKRFRREVLAALEELESGEKSFLLQKVQELACATLRELEQASGLGRERIEDHLRALEEAGRVRRLADQWATEETVRLWQRSLLETVDRWHRDNPLQSGMPRAALKGVLPARLRQKAFDAVLAALLDAGELVAKEELVARADFSIEIAPELQRQLDRLERFYRQAGPQAKNHREMAAQLGLELEQAEPLLQLLFDQGKLVRLNAENSLHRETYNQALSLLRQHFADHETLTLAEFRDIFGSARKLVQALLEYWDLRKYTLRRGDVRVAWKLPKDEQEK